MLKPYRTVQDVLSSPWAQVQRVKRSPQQTDRVLRSTKLEDSIYRDLRMEDTGMDEIENSAGEKLHSFPALSRDIFQSFYSLMPRRNADDDLSVAARKINMPILEHITQSEDYPTLKRCVKDGSFRPMKRRQSLLPRPRENWMTYFPNWAENPALYRRWKSWSRQRKPQRTSSRHCWSSFVGLHRTIRL